MRRVSASALRRRRRRRRRCRRRAAGERRQQHQRQHHREVLDDQPAHRRCWPRRGIQQAPFLQRAQQHHGAGHRQRQAEHQPCAGRPAQQQSPAPSPGRGDGDLRDRARDGDGLHRHQVLQREMQADAEHQQDHADLGQLRRQGLVGDEAGRERPDHDAREQVAHQRRQPQRAGPAHRARTPARNRRRAWRSARCGAASGFRRTSISILTAATAAGKSSAWRGARAAAPARVESAPHDRFPQFRPAPRRTPAPVRCRPDPACRLAGGRGRPQRHRQVLLFAAVRSEIEADRGDLDLPGRVRIASVAQEMPSLPDRGDRLRAGGRCRGARRAAGRGQCVRQRGLGSRRRGASPAGGGQRLRRQRARRQTAARPGLSRPRRMRARSVRSPAAGACA